MKKSSSSWLAALVVIAVIAFVGWRLAHMPRIEPFPPRESIDTASWATLQSDVVGIRIKVPPLVNVFASPENGAGCDMPLVLGQAERNTVFLMTRYPSCEKGVDDNGSVYAYEGSYSTRITVVPVANESEITGLIKGELLRNGSLIGVQEATLGPVQDCQERQLGTVRATIPDEQAAGDATVPVAIVTDGCPISANVLNVRYSPARKKAVIFESAYSAAPAGTYRVPESVADGSYDAVDQAIYRSVEVLR